MTEENIFMRLSYGFDEKLSELSKDYILSSNKKLIESKIRLNLQTFIDDFIKELKKQKLIT